MNLYRLLAVAALFVVSLTVVDQCHRRSISQWEETVAAVEARVRVETERAEVLKREAASANERADSIAAVHASQAPEIRERIVRVQAETPDSLLGHPAVVSRDSIIADLRNESDGWRSAFESQRAAYVKLEGALALAESSRDSLAAVLADRPGARPWYLPRVGVGPFAGVCSNGQACVGPAAVTVSWEVRL